MDILRSFWRRGGGATDAGRRAFIWKLGAGSAGAAASVAVAAKPAEAGIDDPALRAALLEEEKSLRRLHHDFQQAIDAGLHDRVIGMFAADSQVVFNGGIFQRRDAGVSRFFRGHLPARKAGRSMQVAPGFASPTEAQPERIDVSRDRQSATAVFPYSIQAGMPLESASSLASMARLQGEGVHTWWEGGHYRVAYRKEADGRWMISRLEYDTSSRADYRPGRSHASPIRVPRLATRFPDDPHGPDRLA